MVSVILAGGKGLRLWPESRQKRPKQLCKFFGNRSMLDHTIARLLRSGSTDIYIVTNDELRERIEEDVNSYADLVNISVLSEPEGKNTAPAVGLILSQLYEDKRDGILGIFPADHFVGDESSFSSSLDKAIEAARRSHLVTIGVEPHTPETGYGYIEKTRWEIGELPEVFQVNSFCEKPDRSRAEEYLNSGSHLWNAGIYVGHSRTFLEEFAQHLPEIYEQIVRGTESYIASYSQLPNISLDYGIAEKSSRMAVVPSSFQWCDLGSWNALADFFTADGNRNVCLEGEAIFVDSKDCLVRQNEKSLVFFGVENLLIVESDNIILIADRERSQDLRHLTEVLSQRQRHDLL